MSTPENPWAPPAAPEGAESSAPAAPSVPAAASTVPPPPGYTAERAAALPEDLRGPWGWFDLVLLFVFLLLCGFAFAVMIQMVLIFGFRISPLVIGRSGNLRAVVLIASQGMLSLATLLFLFGVLRVRGAGPFWRSIGWRRLRLRDMPAPAAAVLFVVGGAVLSIVVQIASQLVGKKATLPIEELFKSRQAILMLMAMGILLAPLVEETMFRGFIYPVIARSFGVNAGVIATGTLFGLLHAMQLWGGWGQILLLIFVGIVLTYVRARTGTVLASYLLHFSYNSTIFLAFYVATGGLRHLPGAF